MKIANIELNDWPNEKNLFYNLYRYGHSEHGNIAIGLAMHTEIVFEKYYWEFTIIGTSDLVYLLRTFDTSNIIKNKYYFSEIDRGKNDIDKFIIKANNLVVFL